MKLSLVFGLAMALASAAVLAVPAPMNGGMTAEINLLETKLSK
jgi:hypothetical protein